MKLSMKEFKIGSYTDERALTGLTVVLCEEGATAGVDVRGSAPGTRETDLLDPVNTVDKVHAVVLSGGSAFGLAGSTGVMRYLEERGIGFDTGVAKVPIVTQAVIFDLYLGDPKVRPDEHMGYKAARSASEDFEIGNFGAGTGASVGKIRGPQFAMKSGLGYSEFRGADGLVVAALVAVNAMGDVYRDGKIIAGALNDAKDGFADSSIWIRSSADANVPMGTNTTIGVILTNAVLTKAQAKKVAQTAHNGYARAIMPVHTSLDGDTIFAMASGKIQVPVDRVAHLAALEMEKAIHQAVCHAVSAGGLKATQDFINEKK